MNQNNQNNEINQIQNINLFDNETQFQNLLENELEMNIELKFLSKSNSSRSSRSQTTSYSTQTTSSNSNSNSHPNSSSSGSNSNSHSNDQSNDQSNDNSQNDSQQENIKELKDSKDFEDFEDSNCSKDSKNSKNSTDSIKTQNSNESEKYENTKITESITIEKSIDKSQKSQKSEKSEKSEKKSKEKSKEKHQHKEKKKKKKKEKKETQKQHKKHMKLSPIYLANVVLYLPTIESIIKFKMISKKCQEATLMIRLFSQRYEKEIEYKSRELEERNKFSIFTITIPLNLFDIFPKIETIICDSEDIHQFNPIIEKVKQIHLLVTSIPKHFTQQIKKKIVAIKVDFSSKFLTKFPLNEFPLLRYVALIVHFNNWKKIEHKTNDANEMIGFNERLEKIMGNKSIRLRKLVIYTKYFNDMTSLLQYENIDSISLATIPLNENEKDHKYEQLKGRILIQENYFEKFDCLEYVNENDHHVDLISIEETMKRINSFSEFDLKHPLIVDSFDLTKCHWITSLTIGTNQRVILNGLNHLEEITDCQLFDSIPLSVHRLKFTEKYQYQQTSIQFISDYKQIDEIFMKLDTNIELEKFLPIETISLKTLDLTYQLKERFNVDKLMKELKKLCEYTTIENKVIHLHCYHLQLTESMLQKLRKCLTITIDVFVEVNELEYLENNVDGLTDLNDLQKLKDLKDLKELKELKLDDNQNFYIKRSIDEINNKRRFINVKQLPTTIESLKMFGNFRLNYFEDINCLSHITKVSWEIQKKHDSLCLPLLKSLKELVISGYLQSSTQIVNLKEMTTLKSLECFGCCYQLQVPQQLESLTIHNQIQIHNLDDILNTSLTSINMLITSNINFSRFDHLQFIQLNSFNSSKVVVTLPMKINKLCYCAKTIIIDNLHEIKIEKFVYYWDYSIDKIVFSHWNYESENDLKNIVSLDLKISQNFDLRRFHYLKSLKLEGTGNVYIPEKLKHLWYDDKTITIMNYEAFELCDYSDYSDN